MCSQSAKQPSRRNRQKLVRFFLLSNDGNPMAVFHLALYSAKLPTSLFFSYSHFLPSCSDEFSGKIFWTAVSCTDHSALFRPVFFLAEYIFFHLSLFSLLTTIFYNILLRHEGGWTNHLAWNFDFSLLNCYYVVFKADVCSMEHDVWVPHEIKS